MLRESPVCFSEVLSDIRLESEIEQVEREQAHAEELFQQQIQHEHEENLQRILAMQRHFDQTVVETQVTLLERARLEALCMRCYFVAVRCCSFTVFSDVCVGVSQPRCISDSARC